MADFRPKIVVVDGHTLNPGDLSWNKLKALGEVAIFEHSTPAEIIERGKEASVILSNKAILNKEILDQLPRLKCICVLASGYNNIDIAVARARQIPVCNAVGYGTTSVAQHVFALALELTNNIALHHQSVQNGDWSRNRDFSYFKKPITELAGKTMGIYGLGRIGQKVADIALAFEMKVLATHKHPKRDARPNVNFVSIEELFVQSDLVTLHAPLTSQNKGIVNAILLQLMKPTALLINTGRGDLINEVDLKTALETGILAGAALDVLSVEPPPSDHILLGLPNCLITPHQAWASQEARERMMEITVANIKAFLKGKPQNVVNLDD